MSRRTRSDVGVATVREWAKELPPGGAVLDLGCGHGVPISQCLADQGLIVYGIDASPSMIAAFRARLPDAPSECSPVEDSQFFSGRRFDGVVAWGLIFLLAPAVQAAVIHKVAVGLKRGGRFVFTAPQQPCEWPDNLTLRKSVSLGAEAYRQILKAAGLILLDEAEDEGENHYYLARKPDTHSQMSESAAAPEHAHAHASHLRNATLVQRDSRAFPFRPPDPILQPC